MQILFGQVCRDKQTKYPSLLIHFLLTFCNLAFSHHANRVRKCSNYTGCCELVKFEQALSRRKIIQL